MEKEGEDGNGDGERDLMYSGDLKSELLIVCSDSSAKDHPHMTRYKFGPFLILPTLHVIPLRNLLLTCHNL